jgi:hypothetical protein
VGLGLGGGIDALVASATVEGGVKVNVTFALHSPDGSPTVRGGQIGDSAWDPSGQAVVYVNFHVSVFGDDIYDKDVPLGSISLF